MQQADSVAPGQVGAVVLGYGLGSNGMVGLRAGVVPLVIPRAHDCISFLGFRRRYVELFNKRWGTTYYTSGWLERGGDSLLQPSE